MVTSHKTLPLLSAAPHFTPRRLEHLTKHGATAAAALVTAPPRNRSCADSWLRFLLTVGWSCADRLQGRVPAEAFLSIAPSVSQAFAGSALRGRWTGP